MQYDFELHRGLIGRHVVSLRVLAATAAVLGTVIPALAVDYTWTGGTTAWNAAGNWTPDGAAGTPAYPSTQSDRAIFSGSPANFPTLPDAFNNSSSNYLGILEVRTDTTLTVSGNVGFGNFVSNAPVGGIVGTAGSDLIIQAGATGTRLVNLNGPTNGLLGDIVLNSGTLRFANTNEGFHASGGKLIINGGTVSAGSNSNGSGGAGATKTMNRASEVNGDFAFDGNSTLVLSGAADLKGGIRTINASGNGNTSLSGVISNGGLTFTRSGGNGRISLTGSASNTYTGLTTLSSGTLSLSKGSGFIAVAGNLTIDSGQLRFNQNDPIANSATVTLNGGEIWATSDGNSARSDVVSKLVVNGGRITGLANATGSVVATTYELKSGTVDWSLLDVTGLPVSSLTKTGAGVATISSSANTYASSTTVSAGKLIISSTGNINTTSAVNIAGGTLQYDSATPLTRPISFDSAGGTLSGTGQIGASVSAGAGATIAPGNSAGSQTYAAGLAFGSASTYSWELFANTDAGAGASFDQLVVSGGALSVAADAVLALKFASAGSTVNFTDAFWQQPHSWTIIDYTAAASSVGAFVGLTSDLAYSTAGSFATTNEGGDVVLNWTPTPIPEPAHAGLILSALAVLLRRQRDKAKSDG